MARTGTKLPYFTLLPYINFVAEILDKKHTDKHKRAPNYACISHKEYIKTMPYR
jgi:hypothetical protein